MATKQIIYGEEARKKLKAGVDKLSQAVVTTLGPKGRNVAIDRSWGTPIVIHDGVSIAKEIELDDPFENMGAQLVKEASSKTNDSAGDGTTTSTMLAQAIIEEGMKVISSGANPMILRKGLEDALQVALDEITYQSRPITTKEKKKQIATISAQNSEMGHIIAEAMEKVGDNGIITIEESNGFGLDLIHEEGMQFEKGFLSPYFVTNQEKMEVELDNPLYLLTDQRISSIQQILPLLEKVMKVTKNFVIIANQIDQEVISTLVVNKLRGTFNPVVIETPGYGDRRKDILEDIATLVGGKNISEDLGLSLSEIEIQDLGASDKIIVTKDQTVIVGGKGDSKIINEKVLLLQKQLINLDTEFEKQKIIDRIAKLTGGVAIIKVGANTEAELKERKLRVEDAVNATKAAVAEGIVAGGGVTLINAAKEIAFHYESIEQGDFLTGTKILEKALYKPAKMILQNAVGDDASLIFAEILKKQNTKSGSCIGYNVMTNEYGDMFTMGIIDPTKVTKSALTNAVSVAVMVLTTECLITDLKAKN